MPGSIVSTGTIDVGGRTYYIYTSPVMYTFTANALYNFKVTVYGTFASDCPGEDQQIMLINAGTDILNLAANPACNNPSVTFTADTIPMVGTNILSWSWDFGQGAPVTTGLISPQTYTYTGAGTAYTVKLTTRNTIGCLSTESLDIDFGGGLTSAFTISKDTVCTNQLVTFVDGSFGSGTSGSPNSWQWNFDPVLFNGQTPPAQSWSTPGIKTIELTVSTPIGCVKTFKDTVVVEAIPVAAISATPTFVCLGDSAAYSDVSTIAIGSITGWLWSFDDGTTSTLQNPKHKWATPGSHNVTLTVTSAGGCTSTNTATHTINVNPLPVAGFKYDLNCTTRTLNVTDTSNAMGGTINAWSWDFGVTPPATSTLQNPSYIYAASGTYTVTLSVTTVNGCKSSIPVSKTITIAASPVADFTLPGNTCLPNASPVFTNTTTISDGTIALVTYTWNFGDGSGDLNSPPLSVSPTHVFPGTGPYTVSLTAISNNGCTNTKTKPYSSIFAAPVADIAPQAEVCVNSTVNFSSAASTAAGSSVTGWNWNFNNEGNSASQNPAFAFTTAGIKTVVLTVTSAAGCTSAPDTIYVTVNALPTAGFTDTVNCSTFSVGFTDTSVPNAGTISSWNWTFGDVTNNSSTLQNPTHIYPASGSYTVTLSVKTDKGCSSSVAFTNTVNIAARPATDFTLPGNTCLPNASGLFTNTTAISDGTINNVTYTWDFGDTSGVISSPPNPISPSHTYNYAANHTVTLTATSVNGCVKSISKLYDKVFVQPVAVITAPGGVCLGNAANFTSTSSTAPASSVTGWQWGFGDSPAPGASAQQNPTYTYTGSGPRTVSLTVTSAAGCTSATTTQQINVNLSPVAGFTYSAIRCKDSVVTFNDVSVSNAAGGIIEWNWDFGHAGTGGTLTQTIAGPVTHTFTNAQTYSVSLAVKNANGCVSSTAFSTPVVINPNPVSNFNVSDICIPAGLAQFTQQGTISSGQITGWSWDFGVSGAVSSLQNPTYNYATGGEYQAVLKVTSDSSCTAFVKLPVTVYNSPSPSFDVINPNNLCSNLPVSIVNKSVVNGFGSVDKIELFWDYANNPAVKTTISTPVLNDTYTNQYPVFGSQPGKTYKVLIRAYSGNGCTKDTSVDINVLAAPKVQFTQPAPVCQEAASFALTGASDIFGLPGSGIYSGSGVVTSPVFSPSAAGFGSHTIRYTYTTSNGCSDFAEKALVVNPTPVINFGRSTINVLEGDLLKLSPSITNGATYLWTPARYLNSATVASPSGLPDNDIVYNLQVTSDKGCIDDESVTVKVVRKYVVPNTFTPNNDGNHDRWEIENLSLYPDVRVRIFSRSGQLVFESYGYNTAWDGKYKGQDCPFGTYYYVIETGGGRSPRTGYVTVIR
ncbi:MAG: PKD domain-containing protein [Chitinophagaceae bacterium]|nr:PKD domain-containing protein [Chitinophagaceae bacterium]